MLMLIESNRPVQHTFFDATLWDYLDQKDPLVLLAQALNWDAIESGLKGYYTENNGRPALPIRLMSGLLILKQLENLSDEELMLQWKRNPYYQYFCGESSFKNAPPCHATELVKFRKRIGALGVELIFSQSVALHPKAKEEKVVNVDSTV